MEGSEIPPNINKTPYEIELEDWWSYRTIFFRLSLLPLIVRMLYNIEMPADTTLYWIWLLKALNSGENLHSSSDLAGHTMTMDIL